jgi:hypothetical protein
MKTILSAEQIQSVVDALLTLKSPWISLPHYLNVGCSKASA